MTGQEVAVLTALFELLGKIGALPLGMAFFCVIGPWIFFGLLVWRIERGQTRRVETLARMYENNVRLVEDYLALTRSLKQMVEDGQGAMVGLSGTLATLTAAIEKNQFCPASRVTKREVEVEA